MKLDKEIGRISKLGRYKRPEKVKGAAKLDSNENFALDSAFIAEIAAEAAKDADLREYPLDELDALYRQLARYTGISERYIGVGSGSDQIIELLLATLVGRGSRAAVFVPTFSYFIDRCELNGIKVDRVPLNKDFELDAKKFVRRAKNADLVYICSPNNPTGNQLDKKAAQYIIDSLDDNEGKLILIDEAYADFAGYSLAREATRRNNVVVLRTLSKAFGLAGARVGYMVTNAKLADAFKSTIQSPYPISTLSLTIATKVLERSAHVKKTIEQVKDERRRMSERLSRIDGIRTFRSDANFLFIETGRRYRAIAKELEKEGIVVKLLGNAAGHSGCMRVAIGTQEMNDRFLLCVERAGA